MRTENGIDIDIAALEQVLVQADVLTLGFSLFPQRLLIDTRSNDSQGQLATMVEPVASVQERYLWLGKHRGAFGAPAAFSFVVWPQTVGGLRERNILAKLRARLDPEAATALDVGLDAAASLEREAMQEAVRGSEQWPGLWVRGTGGRTGGV